MDTAQWPQEIVVKPMEDIIVPNTCSSSVTNIISNSNNNKGSSTSLERKVRPQKDQALNCPRCNSTNTKFCYYNNYSLTQPRYFCKTCRRYWTEGGSLRNIPVGGGSRKNKRSSSSYSNSSNSSPNSSSKKIALVHDHHNSLGFVANSQSHLTQYPNQDLNLGFPPTTHQEFRTLSEYIQLPTIETTPNPQIPNSSASASRTDDHHGSSAASGHHHNHNHSHHLSALELLNGLTSTRGLTPFMPISVDPNGVYTSGFPALQQDYKPANNNTLSFSLDAFGNGYDSCLQGGGVQQQEEEQETISNNNNNGRLLFPFEDLKQVSSNNTTTSGDQNNNNNNNSNNNNNNSDATNNELVRGDHEQGDSTGYWSGMLGMGGSW